MTRDEIRQRALATGAITGLNTPCAHALGNADQAAAQQFASTARTPIERVRFVLAVTSPGTSLEAARELTSRFLGKGKDPDTVLIRQYGGLIVAGTNITAHTIWALLNAAEPERAEARRDIEVAWRAMTPSQRRQLGDAVLASMSHVSTPQPVDPVITIKGVKAVARRWN